MTRHDSRLPGDGRFDYLLVGSIGMSEQLPVAATFQGSPHQAPSSPQQQDSCQRDHSHS